MRFLLLAAICLLAMVAASAVSGSRATPGVDCLMDAAASEAQLEDLFSSWMKQYEKSYSLAELSDRFMKFKANVALIREHNLQANQTYTLGLNQFADLSAAEFQSEYLGVRSDSERRPHDSRSRSRAAAIAQRLRLKSPRSGYVVDWRSRGAVTQVGTQSASTGVWAYAAAGAFEGAWVAQGGHSLTSVPAEEMADCCNGIQATAVLEQIQCGFRYRGVCSDSAYRPGHCDSCRRDVTVSGYVTIPPGSEFDLFSAVTHQGPVAVQIDASGMQFYSGGIYTGPCTPDTNQGMLAVGYDDDNAGNPYWILKNSWGSPWGEDGYLRLVLDQNACGIAEAASYPQV